MKHCKVLQTKLPDWIGWPFGVLHALFLIFAISELIHMLMLPVSFSK